jgi:hypothetical protein
MRTEAWIALCAVFSVAAFFAGVLYGEAASAPTVGRQVGKVRELERLVDSLERRESVLVAELGRTPGLPAKHVPVSGKIIRE